MKDEPSRKEARAAYGCGIGAIEAIVIQRDVAAEALRQIATGTGYYGEQAREYKEIATAALAKMKGPFGI